VSMPPIKIKIRQDGHAVIVAVSGELDIASAPALAERAARAQQIPAEQLVLELSGLTFIDCAGARVLAAVSGAAPPGCPVLIQGASRRVRKVLAILGVPLQLADTPEPAGPRRPAGAQGPPDHQERHGPPSRDRAVWLRLEAQMVVAWAEQACADSRHALARARAMRSALASHRPLDRADAA
jgi:anti-anti-sigma factor